jgi:hypothetical protein
MKCSGWVMQSFLAILRRSSLYDILLACVIKHSLFDSD